MVHFSSEYSPEAQQIQKPDFSKGASAETAAKYFESIGRNDLAQEAEKVQQLSKYPTSFVIVPPDIAAYVVPWSSDTIFYNLHTLGRGANHEHIVRHESIHLEHQSRWGSTDMPGFLELSPFAQSCFAGALGTAFTERELLEGHTEGKATKQTEYDPDCSYNLHEVPLEKRFDALVRNRSSLSGLDYSTSRSFSQMDQSSSREDFKNGMLLTANQLMLEKTASDMGAKVDDTIATKISYIARDLLQSGKVINSPDEAKHLLKNSPVSILEIKTKMRGELDRIGIGADEVKSIDTIEPQRSINIFGETLERTENNVGKVVQNNFAGRAVNVLQFPGNAPTPRETDEEMLAA